MAKVTGPLMSMGASGKFGGALVFANRIGTNVVRALVTPANPMSIAQMTARNIVRITGAGQHFENLTALKGESRTITDKAGLIAAAPAGQTWNSYLVKLMIGINDVTYTAATAAYAALTSGQKTAWVAAAAALVPAIADVPQKAAGGVPATALSKGEAWFHVQYGLYVGGLASVPTGTPPTYA